MIDVKCFYANGDTVTTGINGTFKEAQDYFVGHKFNLGSYWLDDIEIEDNIQECIRIEEVL